jgi:O-antigen/teichoic acid export membrane protein
MNSNPLKQSSQLKRVSRNSAFLFASRLIDMLAVVISNVIIARSLGASSFGQYSFICAYVVSITMLSYCGLDNLTMRDIARHPDKEEKYLGAIILARRIMSGLALLLILAGLPFIGLEREFLPALALLTVSEFITAYVTIQTAVFRAHEKMIYETWITVFWRLLSLLFIATGAWLGFAVTGLCAVILLANLARAVFTGWISKTNFFQPDFSEARLMLKGLFKDALSMGAVILITNWLFRSAQIAVRFLLDAESVAYFQVSHGIIIQVSVVSLSVMLALFPMLSREARPDKASMIRMAAIYTGVAKLLLCLGLIFSSGLLLLSKPLILFLFGPEYIEAVKVFQVLLVALVPLFMYALHDLLFVAYNKQHYIMLNRLGCLLLLCGLYVLFIPGTGVLGAACTYVIVSVIISFFEALLLSYRVVPFIKPLITSYFVNLLPAAALASAFILEYSWTVKLTLFLLILIIVSWQIKGIYAIIRTRSQSVASD